MGASPRVVDWNNDSKKDLIVGDKYNALLTVFINVGSDASPVFTKQGCLQVGGSNFVANGGADSEPFPVDWNNDGKIDVVCGGSSGKLNLLINSGTSSAPVFDQSTFIQSSGADLNVTYKSMPYVVDWNGDGKKDLLVGCGSSNTIYFFENIGSDAAPVFGVGTVLQVDGLDYSGYYPRLSVYDWDRDGTLDLIVGLGDGTLWFHKRTPLDNDADSMPDWWENRYLPGGTNSVPAADDDNDGRDNSEEFRCRTDPFDANSVLKMGDSKLSGPGAVINWTAATGVTYRVQACQDLTTPSWTNVSGLLNTGTYTVTPDQSRQYYRIVVP